jgi:hypothetical protein
MQIDLEPIAPFCSSRDHKAWNGMLKIHLKNLARLRVFALELEGKTTIAKVAKGYNSSVLQRELSIKIKGETLANKTASTLLIKIVKESFSRGFEFEITQLNKSTSEDHAYIITALLEQKDKIQRYQVSIDNKILTPSATMRQLSAKEIARKNCLVFIAKNPNLAQRASDITKCIHDMIGKKLVVDTYFSRSMDELHNGTANIEILNLAIYKKIVKTTVKLGGKYVKLIVYLQSLD